MISPAILLKEYLIDALLLESPSGSTNWPVYLNCLPDGSDIENDAVALFDDTGIKDGRLMAGTTIEHYGVRIVVRSKEYQDGWNKMNVIEVLLDSLMNEDIIYNGTTYRIKSVTRELNQPIGNEDSTKRRFLFEQRLLLTVSEV